MTVDRFALLRWRATDVFALFNLAIFGVLFAEVYYRPFVAARGQENIGEFFIYAAGIAGVIAVLWLYLRRVAFPIWMLLLMQAGILTHFAGGLVFVDGVRLYDTAILGVGYDNYVHVLNAFAGAAILDYILPARERANGGGVARTLMILLLVSGVGAVVEILEYAVTLVVPNSGVGDYDNNMRDLVANLVGGAIFLGWRAIVARPVRQRPLARAPAAWR